MATDRAQAALDLNAKLRLEARLRPLVARAQDRTTQVVTRALAANGQLPNVAAIEAEAFAPILRDHYDLVAQVFDHRLGDQLPDDVAKTPEEEAIIVAALIRIFDGDAPSHAELIGKTSERNARRSVELSNRESQRIQEEENRVPSLAEEATLAGSMFASSQRGRRTGIVMTETQGPAERAKFQEALVLLSVAPILVGRGDPVADQSQESEKVATQDWVTMGDNKVRTKPGTGHRGADGQTVNVGEPFTVGGQRLLHPGDTSLGATMNNVANCRCSAVANVVEIVRVRRAVDDGDFEEVPAAARPANVRVVDEPLPTNAPQPNLEAETSLKKWIDPGTGNLIPERAALHAEIVDDLVRGAVVKQQKTFHMVGGGTASGKGSVIKSGKVKLPAKAVTVDADDIKGRLPEFQVAAKAGDSNAAAFAHAESSQISEKVMRRSKGEGLDTVLDGTGDGSLDKLRGRIQPFRDAGYRVKADYVTVPTDVAVKRAFARGQKGTLLPDGTRIHRFVPEEVTRELHAGVSKTFPQAARADLFDEVRLFDTDVALGADPILIYERIDGMETIVDRGKWETFLAKADE